MLKFLVSLGMYSLTLFSMLISAPLLAWRFELITIQNFSWVVSFSPVVAWAVFYLHKHVYDFAASRVQAVFKAALDQLQIQFSKSQPVRSIKLTRSPGLQSRRLLVKASTSRY